MTGFASADRVQLGFMKEAAFGVTPASGNPRKLRFTGESLAFDLTRQADKEITPDAQPNGNATVNAQTSGDIKGQMQYAEYDDFLAGALRSVWAEYGTKGVGDTFAGTFTANTISAGVATSGASAFSSLQQGQWFRLNAPASPNNGLWLRVSPTVAPTDSLITLDPSTPLTAEGPIAGCTIATSRVANGVTLTHFSIERQALDVNQYFVYAGETVSKFSTGLTSEQQTDVTFTFLGKNEKRNDATALPGTLQDSYTYELHDSIEGVGTLWENGEPLLSTSVKSVTLDVDSALRAQTALGSLGPVGIGIGTFAVKGKLTVYFKDGALYDKFIDGTYTSFIFSSKDTDGNGYVFTLPRAQLSNGKVQAGGKNTDLMAEFDFEAFADRKNTVPALRKTLFIDRLGAAV